MKFELIDRIEAWTTGERLVAVKAVSRAEEYLGDHFPTFPVLPGVLMFEGLIQAASWLVLESHDFAPRPILLRKAKNVTYKEFVKPGHLLRLEVSCRRLAQDDSDFEGFGTCDGAEVVKARFSLHHSAASELGDAGSGQTRLREQWVQLTGSSSTARPTVQAGP